MVGEAQPISMFNDEVEMLFIPFGVLFDNYRHSRGMLSIGCHLDQADFYQKWVAQNCRQSEYEQFDSNCNLAALNLLTNWGRVTHICVGNLTIIGSNNGLSPGRRQVII